MKFYLVTWRREGALYQRTRAFHGKGAKEAAAVLRRELDADEHTLGVEVAERIRPSRIRPKREGGGRA